MSTEVLKDDGIFSVDSKKLFSMQLLTHKPQIIINDFGRMYFNYLDFPFQSLELCSISQI